jgi:RNA polymerase sigma-70 factor (ECF subfamily)
MHQNQFGELVGPLLQQATAYARSILHDHHCSQDAVQQAALRGLEKINSFDDTRAFKQWWFAILRNICLDILRADKRAMFDNSDALDLRAPDTEETHNEEWEQLSLCISMLNDEQSEILRLKYFADLNYNEIASILHIPRGTVMSRLHAARQALAAKVREEQT